MEARMLSELDRRKPISETWPAHGLFFPGQVADEKFRQSLC